MTSTSTLAMARWLRVKIAVMAVAMWAACGRPAPTSVAPRPATPATDVTEVAPAAAAPRRSPGQDAYDRGFRLATEGDYRAALELFREATELDPGLAVAWFDLAGLWEQMGDAETAFAAMTRCVEVEPRFTQARVELASLYLTVRDDRDAALAHLRRALLEREPFVIERYPAAKVRGEALFKIAAIYGGTGFVGAAASIARSSMADPEIVADPRADSVVQMAENDLELEQQPAQGHVANIANLEQAVATATTRATAEAVLARHRGLARDFMDQAIDAWRILRMLAQLELTAGHVEAASELRARAVDAARRLPLEHWLDARYEHIVLEVRLGRIESAERGFDELAWIEYAAAHADPPVGGRTRSRRAMSDPALAALRSRAAFETTRTIFELE